MEEILDLLKSLQIPCEITSISFGPWSIEFKQIPGTTTTIHLSRRGMYVRGFENPQKAIQYIKIYGLLILNKNGPITLRE